MQEWREHIDVYNPRDGETVSLSAEWPFALFAVAVVALLVWRWFFFERRTR
jgi:hypothetical protein